MKNLDSDSVMSLVSVPTVAERRDIIGLFSFISSQSVRLHEEHSKTKMYNVIRFGRLSFSPFYSDSHNFMIC